MRKKKIDFKVEQNGCFICISHKKDRSGYAQAFWSGKNIKIHRHIYQECFGDIPNNLIVRHKCDNPGCINPEHLEIGTKADNNNDKSIRGRCNPQRGTKNTNSNLKDTDIVKIRELYKNGVTQKEIANKFNVGHSSVNRIVNFKSYLEG